MKVFVIYHLLFLIKSNEAFCPRAYRNGISIRKVGLGHFSIESVKFNENLHVALYLFTHTEKEVFFQAYNSSLVPYNSDLDKMTRPNIPENYRSVYTIAPALHRANCKVVIEIIKDEALLETCIDLDPLNEEERESLKLIYCYVNCLRLRMSNISHKIGRDYCPDPCRNPEACKRFERDYRDTCTPTDMGIYEWSYRCQCGRSFYFDFATMFCRPVDACYSEESICNINGTELCRTDENNNEICTCRKNWGGERCNMKLDFCDSSNNGTGVIECNIHNDENRCTTNTNSGYKCQCNSFKWIRDESLPYDNCLKRVKNSCITKWCIHGDCSLDINGLEICKCFNGFDGSECEKWVGIWMPWSEWSRCIPEVGKERYKMRMRKCESNSVAGMNRGCFGDEIDYFKCEPKKNMNIDYVSPTVSISVIIFQVSMMLCLFFRRVKYFILKNCAPLIFDRLRKESIRTSENYTASV